MGSSASFKFIPIDRSKFRNSWVDKSNVSALSRNEAGTGDAPGRSPKSLIFCMVSEMAWHILVTISAVFKTVSKTVGPQDEIPED